MLHIIIALLLLSLILYIVYKDVFLEEWIFSKLFLWANWNDNINKLRQQGEIDKIINDFEQKDEIYDPKNKLDLEGLLLLIRRATIEKDITKIKNIIETISNKYWKDILKKIWPTIVKIVWTTFEKEDVTFIWLSILHYGNH